MATTTSNLGLTKQSGNEFFDISIWNNNFDIIDNTVKGNEDAVATLSNSVSTHLADNTKQIPHLGTTTNSGDAYSITTTETINANQKFTIKFNANSTSAPTLKINSGTECAIKKANGNNAKLYASVYTLFWDGSVFTLLGEGGEYGTASANDVRNTKTLGTENGVIQGTLDLSKLIPTNIRNGITVDGVTGVMKEAALGNTFVTGSSHSVNNAPVDLASIRLEFYNRIFPNNTGTIQVLKNGVTNVVGSTTINTTNTANATDIESAYITLSESFYPGTLYKVILPVGALKDKFGNVLSAMEYDFTTSATPSAWATVPGTMTVSYRALHGCVGTQSAAYAFCGRTNINTYDSSTEKFNGTSWATAVTAWGNRNSMGCFGTSNAAIGACGTSGSINNSAQTYNGSIWTATGNTTYTNTGLGGFGVQNAGAICGGNNGYTNSTSLYNGSTFASSGNMVGPRGNHGAMGVQNAGLVAGGDNNLTSSEKFNGATWSLTSTLLANMAGTAASGTQDAGLIFGNNHTGTNYDATEKFNGSTWSTTGSMSAGRSNHGGCGTQSSALASGGWVNSMGTYANICEKFFG